jgi:hypothetical protein
MNTIIISSDYYSDKDKEWLSELIQDYLDEKEISTIWFEWSIEVTYSNSQKGENYV